MKLTNSCEKALAVVAILATQKDNIPVSSNILINRLKLSPSYTKKLLRKLVVANIIDSTSGNSGGFNLKKDPKNINLLEIIEAIDGKFATYPDYGTLGYAFFEFEDILEDANLVIKDIFNSADEAWIKKMQSQTLDKIFANIFGKRVVKINWNNI